MEIYIEDFLIQNFLINFCLLKLVEITTKSKTNLFRLTLSSIISAGFSVVSAIYINNSATMNLLKLFCSIVMIAIAFKTTKKSFVFNYILLFIFTFALGGAVTAFSGKTYITNFGVIVSSKVNLNYITICIILLTYAFQIVARKMKFKIKSNSYIFPIKIYFNNQKLNLKAYLDTGNMLCFNDEPVIIINSATILKVKNESLINYLNTSTYINTSTVTGAQKLPIIKCDKVEIILSKNKKCIENVNLALSQNFGSPNYDALLSPYLF